MSLLWIDSMSELNNLSRVYPGGGWSSMTGASPVAGRDGQANGALSSASGSNILTLPSAATTLVVGFALRLAGSVGGNGRMPQFYGDSGSTIHTFLNFDAAGHLQACRTSTSTVLATSAQTWTDYTGWHYVEIKTTVADSGGIFQAYVDGVQWINFTGDTRNAGTNPNIDTLYWYGASTNFWLDDMYVLDASIGGAPFNDFLGDVTVRRLFPNADGAASAWTPSSGTTHNTLVKENPANTTDFVASSNTGDQDLYAMDDLTQTTGTVLAAQMMATAIKTDAGTRNLTLLARGASGGVVSQGPYPLPSAAYAHVAGPIMTTDPDGNGWTIARANALQAGVQTA